MEVDSTRRRGSIAGILAWTAVFAIALTWFLAERDPLSLGGVIIAFFTALGSVIARPNWGAALGIVVYVAYLSLVDPRP